MTFDQLAGRVRSRHPSLNEREVLDVVFATISELGVKVDEASGDLLGVATVREPAPLRQGRVHSRHNVRGRR